MDAGTLHTEIAKVCPITSAAVGDPNDRATWTFQQKPEATKEEIEAGHGVIATIPVDAEAPAPPSPGEVALYDHESRILVLESAAPITMDAFLTKTRGKKTKRGK